MSEFTLLQRSQSLNVPSFNNNNNLRFSLGNEKKLLSHKSLNKLGRKKTVSFSNSISIVNVDNWKSYNIDVSESGGCMAWDQKKNEQKRLEEERRKKQVEEGCQCILI